MDDRAQELFDGLMAVSHAIGDLADMIRSWGLPPSDAIDSIEGGLSDAERAVRGAAKVAEGEASKFEGLNRGPFVVTYTGRRFYPFTPRPDEVCREDIATHLGRTCRFNGATNRLYTVAEHSLNVAEWAHRLAREDGADESLATLTREYALLHDSAEAYMGDLCRVYRQHVRRWSRWESDILSVIYEAVGLPTIVTADILGWIERADNLMLLWEAQHLFDALPDVWTGGLPPEVDPPTEAPWTKDYMRGNPVPRNKSDSLVAADAASLFAHALARIGYRRNRPQPAAPAEPSSGPTWVSETASPTVRSGCAICGAPAGDFGLCPQCEGA